MKYDPNDLKRHAYFDKQMRVFVAAAYFELTDKRLVMAVKTHKHKAMAIRLAMTAGRERTLAGEANES